MAVPRAREHEAMLALSIEEELGTSASGGALQAKQDLPGLETTISASPSLFESLPNVSKEASRAGEQEAEKNDREERKRGRDRRRRGGRERGDGMGAARLSWRPRVLRCQIPRLFSLGWTLEGWDFGIMVGGNSDVG